MTQASVAVRPSTPRPAALARWLWAVALLVIRVVAVGGTWIAKKDDLSAGNWTEIRDRCRTACSIVAHARG